MKVKLVYAGMALAILSVVVGAQAQTNFPPSQPENINVWLGKSGCPPGFDLPSDAPLADTMQIEIWRGTGTNATTFARVWINESTFYDMGTRRKCLRGSGPGGFRLFAVGPYSVRWRGHNEDGYGPWSDFTPFTIRHTARLATRIKSGPRLVERDDDLLFTWTNNFMDSQYQVQIIRGRSVVRSETGQGAFYDGFLYFGYGAYEDRPSSPSSELPNGSYSFRVRAWSPVLRKWSAWAQRSFSLARRGVSRPRLKFTQLDYGGYFRKSPRPFFSADYGSGRTPALWTYFDIRRVVGGQQQVVRREWVSRSAFGYAYNQIPLRHTTVNGGVQTLDLPAGEYVWRVRAWNAPGAGNSVWTAFRTNRVVAAGRLPQPGTSNMEMTRTSISWALTPNAYMYNLKIFKNGVLYQNDVDLDPRTLDNLWIWAGESGGQVFKYQEFEPGTYTFRVQAVNRGNPSGQQYSPWRVSRTFVLE